MRKKICTRALQLPLEWMLARAALATAERRVQDGVTLMASIPEGVDHAFVVLRDALSLIGQIDELRLRRIRTHMPRVGVTVANRDEYVAVIRSGFVSAVHFTSPRIPIVAAVLVGLAARARVSNASGGWRADAVAKPRLLRMDVLEQLRFVSKLPPALLLDSAEYISVLERRRGP